MSRETEKVFLEFQKFLDEHGRENMSEDDIDVLAKLFFEQYNDNLPEPVTPETAETAEDWLELAEDAESDAETRQFAKKALKQDPDNLDAVRILIQYSEDDEVDQLHALKQAVEKGTELMKQKGYMEDDVIGDFWGVLETRSYMRLRRAYVDALTDLNMLGRAAEECQDMLRLCVGDNLGIRYTLMHLYAAMEREEEALALHQQFDGYDETQMLLPLSVLYYKRENFDKALWYLKKLEKANPDTRKFFQSMKNGTVNKLYSEKSEISYRPGTLDEFLIVFYDEAFLYTEIPEYFDWGHKMLRKRK